VRKLRYTTLPRLPPRRKSSTFIAYDLVGNVTQRLNGTLGLTENFYYGGSSSTDKLYRLQHSTLSNGSPTAPNLELTYDPSGGILTKEQPALEPLIPQTISWTSYNYPSEITAGNQTAEFSYGPDRQRWKMVYNNNGAEETTHYIGGLLERVQVGSNVAYRHSIVGGNGAIAALHPIKRRQRLALCARRSPRQHRIVRRGRHRYRDERLLQRFWTAARRCDLGRRAWQSRHTR
jgi:hypothetical protein